MTKVSIFVDADACPVKEEIRKLADAYQVPAVFVASYAHKMNDGDSGWVYVDPDSESVDLYIVNHAGLGDIAVTQDLGLASLLTGKRVYVLTPAGKHLKEENMSTILQTRHIKKKALRAGHRIKGPKPFSDEDRNRFAQSLETLLKNLEAGKGNQTD